VTKADGTEHGFLLLTKSNIDLVLLLDTRFVGQVLMECW